MKPIRIRKIGDLLFVIFLILSLIGCGKAQPTEVKGFDELTPSPNSSTSTLTHDPKTLFVTIYGNPIDLDPASNSEGLANLILFNTSEGLVRAGSKDEPEFVPQLAEKWENNSDFTIWKFYLRKNVKFHDGSDLDASAVKSSFTRLIKSKLAYSFILSQFIEDPDSQIIVRSPSLIEFHFPNPTPLLLKALSSSFGTIVISPKSVTEHEKNGDWAHEWLQTHDAGSGPYVLTEWLPNEQIVLTKFADWWGWEGDSNFEKIVLKIVPERTSRRSLIERGDVDIAFDFSPEDWSAFQKDKNLVLHLSNALTIQYIAFGDYGPLKDPLVRQAISYAFDYDGYTEQIWKGYVNRANSVFPDRLVCYSPDVFKYQTDLQKASELLKQAGVSKDLTLTYMTTGDRSEGVVGQILQSQLAKIGINLIIEHRDVASYVSVAFGDSAWPNRPELFGFTYWPDYNDPTDFTWYNFHSAAAGSKGGNIGLYSNDLVDSIIDRSVSITDQDELCKGYLEVQNILIQQDPAWIPLLQLPNEAVLRTDIGGYSSNPVYHNMFEFWNLYRLEN